jgi:hypothetical protein
MTINRRLLDIKGKLRKIRSKVVNSLKIEEIGEDWRGNFFESFSSRFMPSEILEYARKNYKLMVNYKSDYEGYVILWRMYYMDRKEKVKMGEWLMGIIRYVNVMIEYFNKNSIMLKRGNRIENLEINLMMTPFKKRWNREEEINPSMVNSGFSVVGGIRPEIFIFRKEEVEKVLLHEVIHVLGITNEIKSIMNNSKNIGSVVSKTINYMGEGILIDEAYTDFLAIIFYGIWKSIESGGRIDIDSEYIIDRANFLYRKYKDNWKENTNGYSYYVLKGIMFNDMDFYGNYLLDSIEGKEVDSKRFDYMLTLDILEGVFKIPTYKISKSNSLRMIS